MEFFSFADEAEASDSLPSGCNNNELKDEEENDNIPRDAFGLIASSRHNTANLHGNEVNNQQNIMDNSHEQLLLKAQEKRYRARRFSSFTSWMPDLQRVWAPKQPRAEKVFLEPLPTAKSKRRKRRESISDMVCETPMTGKKDSHVEGDGGSVTKPTRFDNPCRSLPKALFQHDGDYVAGND